MNPPTVTHGATVVSLPHPDIATPPVRSLDMRMVSRRTIGGRLRTTVLSRGFVYSLTLRLVPRATYDALADLLIAAIAAGTYPTFDYRDVWPQAVSAPVSVTLGPATLAVPAVGARVDFELTLEEVDPR